LPLRKPTTAAPDYFGGIEMSMSTWSGQEVPFLDAAAFLKAQLDE